MDWSGNGRWTGTHAARQAEPGHGTAVATTWLGWGTRAAGGRQGWCRACLGVEAGLGSGSSGWGWGGGGGGGGGGVLE